MKEIEDLLRRNREAGALPELPDPVYTAAVVRRRLGPVPEPTSWLDHTWALLAGGVAGAAALALAALALGASPWWLLAAPVSALPLWPILLRKGA